MMRKVSWSLGFLLIVSAVMIFSQRQQLREVNSGIDDADEITAPPLTYTVYRAKSEAQPEPPPTYIEGNPLSEEETQALLKRLPPLPETPEKSDFSMRGPSLPPPRSGNIIKESFPPQQEPTRQDTSPQEPLTILRVAPEGEVELGAHVSVTFSQPMVPVGSHEDLARMDIPVTMNPSPPGRWRWVGTQTLLFEQQDRLPMATRFELKVAAGTSSAVGNALEAEKTWSFTTPPPTVVQSFPVKGTQPPDPLLFLAFDQAIDPERVISFTSLKNSEKTYQLRLASDEEVQSHPQVAALAKKTQAQRWLAVKPTKRLPLNSNWELQLAPGLPSAEGPLTTTKVQSFPFRVYGPFKITESRCGWNDHCPPGSPWQVIFSNAIDRESFQESWISVEPALEDLTLIPSGTHLSIRGAGKGQTQYSVTISENLRDVFGQTLGEPATLTFKVDSARPQLFGAQQGFSIQDPAAVADFSVFTINTKKLRAVVRAVLPQDWHAFKQAMKDRRKNPDDFPGKAVFDKVLDVAHQPETLVETKIDLSPGLKNGLGHLVVWVGSLDKIEEKPSLPGRRQRKPNPVISWVQATQIGLGAFTDNKHLTAWVTDLKDGTPHADATVEIFDASSAYQLVSRGKTNSSGLWQWQLPETPGPEKLLLARLGKDVALLPENPNWWGHGRSSWRKAISGERFAWYVTDDRGIYRPGESVHIKGWVRLMDSGQTNALQHAAGRDFSLKFKATDSRGNLFAEGETQLSDASGFHLDLAIPDSVNLGHANLNLELHSAKGRHLNGSGHLFQIQEFRRPEFEVKLAPSKGPHFIGDRASVEVQANYYSGGPLTQAPTQWNLTVSNASFTPPNLDDYAFGHWTPWWSRPSDSASSGHKTQQGTTDSRGTDRINIEFEAAHPPTPKHLRVQANVRDLNFQQWGDQTQMLVHPANLYVGLRSSLNFVPKNTPFNMEAMVADLDGRPVENILIDLLVVREKWAYRDGQWKTEEQDPQEFQLRSGNGPVAFQFQTPKGGTYKITAHVRDQQGRLNETVVSRWVSGGKRPTAKRVEQETVDLIPDKRIYKPGETAEILLQAPFFPAQGLMTLQGNDIFQSTPFDLKGPSHTLKVPITQDCVPNFHLQIDLVGAAQRADESGQASDLLPTRPAFARGSLNLQVPPRSKSLTLDLKLQQKELSPGGSTNLTVAVRDGQGLPVADSEIAVIVVDEAVLALAGYQLKDPLKTFFPERAQATRDYHSRAFIYLADPGDLKNQTGGVQDEMDLESQGVMAASPAQSMRRTMAVEKAMSADSGASEPVAIRKDFAALAGFFPKEHTDKDGELTLPITLPDNLTRYRVMAIGAAGTDRFGKGETTLTARLPMMVRPSPPRFLNFGDQFKLPVTVQNQTDHTLEIKLVAQAQNAQLTEGSGRKLSLPARDKVALLLPAKAESPGKAIFQILAASSQFSDAAQFETPVWTPATTEAFATYGVLDEGGTTQPVAVPGNVYEGFGGVTIQTSSSSLQALADAVLYLRDYPFQCAEQVASRVLAFVALKDIVAAFGPEIDLGDFQKRLQEDLENLARYQNNDGGFGFWSKNEKSWPFLSVHVAHALARAEQLDFSVPPRLTARLNRYLQRIETHLPDNFGKKARFTVLAYSHWVKNLRGQSDPEKAATLMKDMPLTEAPLEALGWLLPVVEGQRKDLIMRHLTNRTTETAGTATFATHYEDSAYLILHSSRREDAVILNSLIETQPQHDLIPKIVRGLLAHRTKGRWNNTQENVFVLLALEKYFRQYESQSPDFTARAWLGQSFAGEQTFSKRSLETHTISIPMEWLRQNASKTTGTSNLHLDKNGKGRLYYRLGMQYAPDNLQLEPASHGFYVERKYEAVKEPGDVTRDDQGRWVVKAGAQIKVTLTMVAPSRRYHVALVDPLPAGLEAVNPESPVSTSQNSVSRLKRIWWWRWYEHQNLRDERAEAFASVLRAGVHQYSYIARATTPGEFVVPPAKAEEMYQPETFGRSATDRLLVVEPSP